MEIGRPAASEGLCDRGRPRRLVAHGTGPARAVFVSDNLYVETVSPETGAKLRSTKLAFHIQPSICLVDSYQRCRSDLLSAILRPMRRRRIRFVRFPVPIGPERLEKPPGSGRKILPTINQPADWGLRRTRGTLGEAECNTTGWSPLQISLDS